MFFHFVKIGTRNIQIPELLQQWLEFKKSDEYKKLKECNAAKSAEELELKNKRDRLRFALFDKRKRGAAEAELDEALALYKEAQASYVATGRAGRRRGVAQASSRNTTILLNSAVKSVHVKLYNILLNRARAWYNQIFLRSSSLWGPKRKSPFSHTFNTTLIVLQ